MQRLVYLYSGTSRLIRIGGLKQLNANKLFCEKGYSLFNVDGSVFKRYLATKNRDSNTVDTHADLYKPSTAKHETHVPDEIKGHHQSPDTFESAMKTPAATATKVWSAQNPEGVHVAPLGGRKANFIPSSETGQKMHETTVYATQGEVNIADPFKTHTLQPEATSLELAEAEAASAFDTFAPDTPMEPGSTQDAVFSPKISSSDVYKTTSSPTSNYGSAPASPGHHHAVKYETSNKGTIYGGHDTSTNDKKHPEANPFNLHEKIKIKHDK